MRLEILVYIWVTCDIPHHELELELELAQRGFGNNVNQINKMLCYLIGALLLYYLGDSTLSRKFMVLETL